MAVIEIKSDVEFHTITNEAKPDELICLYFHTSWAEPCAHMASVFASLSDVYPQYKFLSIDAEELADISDMLDVGAVPYSVILKDKTIIKEISGAQPKALAEAIQQASGEPRQESVAPTSGTATPQTEEPEEELETRLRKLVSAAPVMAFIKGTPAEPKCGFSRQLVGILREHQVRFGFFDILKDNAVRQGLKTFSDWPTFPQLYINGELQGGLDIVKEMIEEDPKFFENAVASS